MNNSKHMYLLGLEAKNIVENTHNNCKCEPTDLSYDPVDRGFWIKYHKHGETIVINDFDYEHRRRGLLK